MTKSTQRHKWYVLHVAASSCLNNSSLVINDACMRPDHFRTDCSDWTAKTVHLLFLSFDVSQKRSTLWQMCWPTPVLYVWSEISCEIKAGRPGSFKTESMLQRHWRKLQFGFRNDDPESEHQTERTRISLSRAPVFAKLDFRQKFVVMESQKNRSTMNLGVHVRHLSQGHMQREFLQVVVSTAKWWACGFS